MADQKENEIRRQIDSICNDFRKGWSAERRPEIESWLKQIGQEHREQSLAAILAVDLELRQMFGLDIRPQEYEPLGAAAVEMIAGLLDAQTATRDFGIHQGSTIAPAGSTPSPRQIGPYKLLQPIGEGGMGTVWLAEQSEPVKRRVALKLIKSGVGSKEILARFEGERQALALMNHPNIARILDAGTTDDGQPYFVMELVVGTPLTRYCDDNRIGIDERLSLFTEVCSGVQHAHQKGIIHRDLKPGNILVGMLDGKPVPKIIDFGLAKAMESAQRLTDQSLFTGIGQILGTLKYMSPEQASLEETDIDTRTDIYALGVILYELLTGSTPLDDSSIKGQAALKVLEFIREKEPIKPSSRLGSSTAQHLGNITGQRQTDSVRLSRILTGDLDWIVMKALEKDRTRRYASASGFAADVDRYLNSEPVVARPPSMSYVLQKLIRRNRVAVLAGSAVAAALLIGAVGFAWQARIARLERDDAISARKEEARQRRRADLQRDIAVAAEKAERARADELDLVSTFQANMLRQVDPTEAGIRLTRDVNDRFREAMDNMNVPEGEHLLRIEAFRQEWLRVNATDTALALIDETILKPAVKEIDDRFMEKPLIAAKLRQALADRYRDLALFDSAFPLQQSALETRRRLLGEKHPDTLVSTKTMGLILQGQGKLNDAEVYVRSAFETRRDTLGKLHADYLDSLHDLATLLDAQGNWDQAEVYLEEALQGRRSILGEDHPLTIDSINNLAVVNLRKGNLTGAEKHFRDALERSRRVMGNDDRTTLMILGNLGNVLQGQGKLEEAETFQRESLDGSRRVLGEDHPETLASINNIASLYFDKGRPDEAEKHIRDALQQCRRILGEDHPDTLTCINSLAMALQAQAKLDDAAPYFSELLDKRRRVLGDEHPSTLAAINNWGMLLLSQGKFDEAEPYCREVLTKQRRVLGEDHPATLASINNLASLLQEKGMLEEAENYRRESLEKLRRVLGDEHPNTLRATNNLGVLLRQREKPRETVELLEPAEAAMRNAFTDANVWRVGLLLANLGRARVGLGYNAEQFKLAESNLVEAHSIYSSNFGDAHKDTQGCVQGLVDLYSAWHAEVTGKGYDLKAAEWKARIIEESER
jgi:eukaryotic-like serine/threonine-protein kinase